MKYLTPKYKKHMHFPFSSSREVTTQWWCNVSDLKQLYTTEQKP